MTPHFTLKELTKSQTAERLNLPNVPDDAAKRALCSLCQSILEPLREGLGKPIRISSGYRSPEVNKAVGGSPKSQHIKGEAVDIDQGTVEGNREVFEWLKANADFDQLIDEYDLSWVHVSYRDPEVYPPHQRNRRQVLALRG